MVLLMRVLWARRVSTLLVLVLTGLLAWSWSSRVGASSPGAFLTPTSSVQSYLDGRSHFDAPAMWDAMSEEYRSSYGSVQGLQQWLERIRRQGSRYIESKYVAGYALSDGRQVYLYVASVEQGDQVQEVPYTFTVNQAGKIVRID